jgi:hypothetical protein
MPIVATVSGALTVHRHGIPTSFSSGMRIKPLLSASILNVTRLGCRPFLHSIGQSIAQRDTPRPQS